METGLWDGNRVGGVETGSGGGNRDRGSLPKMAAATYI